MPDTNPRGQNEEGIPWEVAGAVSPGGGKPVEILVGYAERHEGSIILAGEAGWGKHNTYPLRFPLAHTSTDDGADLLELP